MNKLTYRQAYDKIIEAYFRDEFEPFDAQFCFCGTLCGGSTEWHINTGCDLSKSYHNDFGNYSGKEYVAMETALLRPLTDYGGSRKYEIGSVMHETALFEGMCAALEVLKQIHRERGEDVDEVPLFNKRELKTV